MTTTSASVAPIGGQFQLRGARLIIAWGLVGGLAALAFGGSLANLPLRHALYARDVFRVGAALASIGIALDTYAGVLVAVELVVLVVFSTIGLAVLRHQLWEINVVINRTLVWGALTGTITLVLRRRPRPGRVWHRRARPG